MRKLRKFVVLICGDRNWSRQTTMRLVFDKLKTMKRERWIIIVHGDARGADSIAGALAKEYGFECAPHPADWELYGKAAGPIRNQEMLDEEKPHIVLAFHANIESSKGTKDMLRRAKKAGIKTKLYKS